MKKSNFYPVFLALTLAAYILSACGAVPAASPQSAAPADSASPKVNAAPVAFLGVVEAMNGNQWVVSGQTVAVDPKALQDPAIRVGDKVRVEGMVGPDGSLMATRVEPSGRAMPALAFDVTGTSDPSATPSGTPDPSTTPTSTPDSSGTVSEVVGVLEAISDTSITVNGQVYALTSASEINDLLAVGDLVKVHYQIAADGSFVVVEVSLSDSMGDDNSNENSNTDDENSNGNSNDDDSNGNGNANDNTNINDDDDDDDSNGNDNGNTNEDDDDNSNSNDNSNGNSDDD